MDSRNLVFDQYQRYGTLSQLIEYHRQADSGRKFKILELGSNSYKNLSLFLPRDNILFSDTQLDDNMKQDEQFAQVDGTAIPFSDQSFDFVVAADVLEHVPDEKREDFILEACRVATIGVIICFPQDKPYVKAAEARVNAYYRAIQGEDYIWLQEHKNNGLPRESDVENLLNKNGFKYFSLSHGTINCGKRCGTAILMHVLRQNCQAINL